jgi:hypothetical protein
MDDKKKASVNVPEELDTEWGETHQERIVERSPKSKSSRHVCKGRGCETAFEKL